MKCNHPDKKCILRGTKDEPLACRVLSEGYEGECKFRKESENEKKEMPAPVVLPKPKKEEAVNKEEPADLRDTKRELKDRIKYVANMYGSHWREEEKFLKGCEEAFKEIARLTEKNRWHTIIKEKPKKDCEVILLCMDKDKKEQIVMGAFIGPEFIFDDKGDDLMVPVKWKEFERPRRVTA